MVVNSDAVNAIPDEIALELCAEIREQNRGKWCTFAGLQCWGCSTFCKGHSEIMRFGCRPDNRACNLVNAAYDRRNQPGATQ
jgi:hypothetical protein